MKRTILTILLLTAILTTINGMQFCGIKKGLYLDVKTSVYKLYKPLETITNNYIQVDSNKEFKIMTTAEIEKINADMVQACTIDMAKDKNIICD